MKIVNQDHDEYYNLSTKDIFYRPHFGISRFRILFMGWNLYGRTQNGRMLLGTFDSTKSCKITKAEIKQHEKAGLLTYKIPEEADDLEDIDLGEVEGNKYV